MRTLFNEWLLHFFVGGGFGFFAVMLFRYFRTRRPIFRFGGDDPVSIGDKSKWILWYVVVCGFELGTSFFTNRLYLEFALSVFQATGGTIALFLVDRIAMMFEPQSYWMPKQIDQRISVVMTAHPDDKLPVKIAQDQSSIDEALKNHDAEIGNHKKDVAPESFAEAEIVDDLDVRPDVSWFRDRVSSSAEKMGSGWQDFLRMVSDGFRYQKMPQKQVPPKKLLPFPSQEANSDEEIKRMKEEQVRKFNQSIKGF